ncbi:MAG: DUF6498-containing protein [Candidatus Nomurabacteria bacterium]|nr:DUF6498-containing protein [Candidatus Nomurabacteria bacterium]
MCKKINSSDIALILANCVPLAGVLFFNWSLFSLLISYWLETGVIGIFVFIKSIYLYKATSKSIFLINGFVVLNMCGGFMFGHFIGIMALFSVVPGGNGWTGLNLFNQSSVQLLTMLVTLSISHGYSFFYNFIGRNEKASIIELIKTEPLGGNSPKIGKIIMGDFLIRIVLTQFTVIFGGIILVLTKTPIYLSAIFIIIKTVIDLFLHRKKHGSEIT